MYQRSLQILWFSNFSHFLSTVLDCHKELELARYVGTSKHELSLLNENLFLFVALIYLLFSFFIEYCQKTSIFQSYPHFVSHQKQVKILQAVIPSWDSYRFWYIFGTDIFCMIRIPIPMRVGIQYFLNIYSWKSDFVVSFDGKMLDNHHNKFLNTVFENMNFGAWNILLFFTKLRAQPPFLRFSNTVPP